MKITTTISGMEEAIANIERKAEKAARNGKDKAVNDTISFYQNIVPVDTGELQKNITVNKTLDKTSISFNTDYFKFVDEGHKVVVWGKDLGYLAPQNLLQRSADLARDRLVERVQAELDKMF